MAKPEVAATKKKALTSGMRAMPHMTLSIPKLPDAEAVALAGLEHFARSFQIPEDKANLAGILTSEAIINALEHVKSGKPLVRVEFKLNKTQLCIRVRDYGHGFDVAETERTISAAKEASASHKRGWGLRLMRSMSDHFSIVTGRTGSVIEMHVNL
jgi:anti-sigma regulatory factor (Ser/Thr protein kinase)